MNKQKTSIPICCWAAEDIPTVKAGTLGYGSLSNSELLSIIIGNGTMTENAVELSRRLLSENDNSLRKISKQRIKDLKVFNGIGEIKASKILAALELGNRINMERVEERSDLGTAVRVFNYMQPRIGDLDVEEFWALYLNTDFKLLQAKRISIGGLNETMVDVRVLMREAVLCNAIRLVVCHNHPSGRVSPSRTDDELTTNIKRACELMRIHLNDHVVVTENGYYSYHEQGKL